MINEWPHLYKVPLVWLAIATNIGIAILTLYTSILLDSVTNASELAFLMISIGALVGVASLLNSGLMGWMFLLEEHTTRRILNSLRLQGDRNIKQESSISNMDLPISISLISFFIGFPATVLSAIVFLAYIAYWAPLALAGVALALLLAVYPLLIFSRWRKRIILSIRDSRNRLVDRFDQTEEHEYYKEINKYGLFRMELFWKNNYAMVLLQIVTLGILYLTLTIAENTENPLSITLSMGMLMSKGHAIFNSLCNFQETRYSLNRVKDAINNCIASNDTMVRKI